MSFATHAVRESRSTHAGLSLVELLVALAIGTFAILGALAACIKARDVQAALDAHARLQETARYAMAVVEADVRMAGFWGLTSQPANITTNSSLSFPAKCGGASWVTDASALHRRREQCVSHGDRVRGVVRRRCDRDLTCSSCDARADSASPHSVRLVTAANRDRVMIVTSHAQGQIFVPRDLASAIPAGYATSDIAASHHSPTPVRCSSTRIT
jgi:hypothetical protein